MSHSYSLAYLTSNTLTPPQAIQLAAELGYRFVGLRLVPNAAGAPQQALIGRPDVLREALAVQRDTGVGVFDLEIIRIGKDFDPRASLPLLETGAALKAKAVLVAGDDADPARLADSYARLCELMLPYGMTADLEFMPWTAVPDARAALGIVDAAGRPANAGILADALHVARSGTTFDDLRALPRRIAPLRADLRRTDQRTARPRVHGGGDDPHRALRTLAAWRGRHRPQGPVCRPASRFARERGSAA
ncbi:sugar phosphate isomerase/epimerase family protein [Cupriavidus basilensis]